MQAISSFFGFTWATSPSSESSNFEASDIPGGGFSTHEVPRAPSNPKVEVTWKDGRLQSLWAAVMAHPEQGDSKWLALVSFTSMFVQVHSCSGEVKEREALTQDSMLQIWDSQYHQAVSVENIEHMFATEGHPPQFLKELVQLFVKLLPSSEQVLAGLIACATDQSRSSNRKIAEDITTSAHAKPRIVAILELLYLVSKFDSNRIILARTNFYSSICGFLSNLTRMYVAHHKTHPWPVAFSGGSSILHPFPLFSCDLPAYSCPIPSRRVFSSEADRIDFDNSVCRFIEHILFCTLSVIRVAVDPYAKWQGLVESKHNIRPKKIVPSGTERAGTGAFALLQGCHESLNAACIDLLELFPKDYLHLRRSSCAVPSAGSPMAVTFSPNQFLFLKLLLSFVGCVCGLSSLLPAALTAPGGSAWPMLMAWLSTPLPSPCRDSFAFLCTIQIQLLSMQILGELGLVLGPTRFKQAGALSRIKTFLRNVLLVHSNDIPVSDIATNLSCSARLAQYSSNLIAMDKELIRTENQQTWRVDGSGLSAACFDRAIHSPIFESLLASSDSTLSRLVSAEETGMGARQYQGLISPLLTTLFDLLISMCHGTTGAASRG
jgi:hypothetical protein